MKNLFHLLQFTDSAFPVGTFSFSNGLETASHLGLVHNADTLESYCASVARQSAFCDGVCAIHAYRAAIVEDYEQICRVDRQLLLFKMNDEARQMLTRMGKKMAELGAKLYADKMICRWLEDIRNGTTPGTYPVAQAIIYAMEGLDEEELFISHQYGVINMVLSAALRCVRVSHYDTQKILFNMGENVKAMYEQAKSMGFDNINTFVPEIDIFASLHEKGKMRMFMN